MDHFRVASVPVGPPGKVTEVLAGRLFMPAGTIEAGVVRVGITNALSRPPCGGHRDGRAGWIGE